MGAFCKSKHFSFRAVLACSQSEKLSRKRDVMPVRIGAWRPRPWSSARLPSGSTTAGFAGGEQVRP